MKWGIALAYGIPSMERPMVWSAVTIYQKDAMAYYQRSMDEDAYMVAQHIMYDTVHYNADSLRIWVANLNSVEGDLWLSNHYLASGSTQQANSVLDAMSGKHHLTAEKQADIADFKAISSAIAEQDPNNLNEAALQTVQPIAFGPDGWARGWARRLLTQHGWHFAPEYVKYGSKSEERNVAQGQAGIAGTLQVQPNPANDYVIFTIPNATLAATLQIFDMNGRLVAAFTDLQPGSTLTWHSSDAASGVYYYNFIAEGSSVSGKILLNK